MIPEKCNKCPFKNVRKLTKGTNKTCVMCEKDGMNGVVDFNEVIKDWGEKIRRERKNDQKFIYEIVKNYFAGNCLFGINNSIDHK